MSVRNIIFTALLFIPLLGNAENLLDVYKEAQISDPVWLGAVAGNRAAQEATEQSFAAFLPRISGASRRALMAALWAETRRVKLPT